MKVNKTRVVVIGSGPAGLTAALYTSRAQLDTVVIVGPQLGGQIATTHEVENYPGFPEGTTGPELVEAMRAQAEKFGTTYVYDVVTAVDFENGSPFRVETGGGEVYLADAVIVTIGANPRKLNIPGESEFVGHGVSYCATCDGFFFRGKDIVVVGGGDSAIQEALFLTKFGKTVDVIHRRDELRASVALQSRAFAHEKISFTWDTVVEEVKGNEKGSVTGIVTRNLKTGEVAERSVDGVFIFIGYDPNSDVFNGQLATDEAGYVMIDQLYRTNVEGVFAAGEIHDQVFRQAITAAGDGCAAALTAIAWLEDHEDELQTLDVEPEPVAEAGD
ncbi:MAG: thioredoxin-disulfide reductase [Anaerolineaceae bacterium]|nr:thioredoxin-disulfide reductase [Anaerolineaceae bacterium]